MDIFARFVAFLLTFIVIKSSKTGDCQSCDYGCNVSETNFQPTESKLFFWIVGYYPPESFHNCGCTGNDTMNENTMIIWCSRVCNDYMFFGIQNRTCSCMNTVVDMAMFSPSHKTAVVSSTTVSTSENIIPASSIHNNSATTNTGTPSPSTGMANMTNITPVNRLTTSNISNIAADEGTTSLPADMTTMANTTLVNRVTTNNVSNITTDNETTSLPTDMTTMAMVSRVTTSKLGNITMDKANTSLPINMTTKANNTVTTPPVYETTTSTDENMLTVYFKEREDISVSDENQDNDQQEMVGFQRKCATVKGDPSNMGFSLQERNCCDCNIPVLCQNFDSKANDFKQYSDNSSGSDWFTANKYCRKMDTSLFNGHDFHKSAFSESIQNGTEYWTGLIIFHFNTSHQPNVSENTCPEFTTAIPCEVTSNRETDTVYLPSCASASKVISTTSEFQSSEKSSKYSSESTHAYGFNHTTYISQIVTSVKIVDSSSTKSNVITSSKQTNKVQPESSTSKVVSTTSGFQATEKSSKFSSRSTHVHYFNDTTNASPLVTLVKTVDTSSTKPNLVQNSKERNKGISDGVLGTIIAVAIVVAAVIIGIIIYLKRRRRSNMEKLKDEEKSVLHTRNITPGYQDVDITETALSETSLPAVQVENLSRITHINNLYGVHDIHSNNIDSENVPDVKTTDNKNDVYAVVIKPKRTQKTSNSSNDTGKPCLPINKHVDGEQENVKDSAKDVEDQNGKVLKLKNNCDVDDTEYHHLHSMKITGSRKKTGDDDVYDHTGHHGTSGDRDLYDHFDNKRNSNTDSTYDTTKPRTTCDSNSDIYDHMHHGEKPMATADDVYDHVTEL